MSSHTNMYKDLHFDTYDAARDVLDSMHDIAKTYGKATAANLMDLVDCQPVFADTKFFWTEPMLRHSEILQGCPDGCYILKFIDPIHELNAPKKVKVRKTKPATGLEYWDVLFQSRKEAEDTLDKMREIADDYGVANVTDLKDLAGVIADYRENKFGWTDSTLRKDIEVVWTKGGYKIDLPRPIPIYSSSNEETCCECGELEKPEPIFITINRDVYEDVDDVLKSLFKNMACLPGREFRITIE